MARLQRGTADTGEELPAHRILKLDGRMAIITGSVSGMGQPIVEAFEVEGAGIALLST